jgi:hypothetical protein
LRGGRRSGPYYDIEITDFDLSSGSEDHEGGKIEELHVYRASWREDGESGWEMVGWLESMSMDFI